MDDDALPKTSAAWRLLMVAGVVLIAIGVASFAIQTRDGFIATALRNPGQGGAAWGLYIAGDAIFTGWSFAGITVAAIARLMRLRVLEPITRLAELLTITSLLAGASTILADLGRPMRGLVNLPRTANPTSPFYGTFTLVVAGYLFSSVVYFFLAGRHDAAILARAPGRPLHFFYRLWASGHRGTLAEHARHRRASFWLSVGIVPLLVAAKSTLGFIFGLQAGRPGWFGAMQAPAFVVMAALSGTGALILMALVAKRLFRTPVPDESLRWLGNLLWVLSLIYLYFLIVEQLTAGYAAPAAERAVAHEVVAGAFAHWFWTVIVMLVGTVAIGFGLFITRRTSHAALAAAGIASNIAAVVQRVLIVVPSQTHGALMPLEGGSYVAAAIEIGVMLGLFGIMAVAFLVFGRIFPLVPGEEVRPSSAPDATTPTSLLPIPREPSRAIVTWATIVVALGMIAIGLADSFRMIDPTSLDTSIPYSPVLFAAGLMTLFGAAIVYETWPSRAWSLRRGVHGTA